VNPLSAHDLVATLGPWAAFLVLFAETGLLVGFVLPGDSLLLTAGLLTATTSSRLHLSLTALLVLAPAGAVLGAQTGFVLGRWLGPALVDRPLTRPRLNRAGERASRFLDEYGVRRAVVLARFVPGARTVINPLAGALDVPTGRFVRFQVGGGVVWTVGLLLVGHWFGRAVPSIDHYSLPVAAGVVALSLTPMVLESRRQRFVARTITPRAR
jgi:membrane-associated protein